MPKILRPVDPEKRKPPIATDNPDLAGLKLSGVVIVRYINKTISESFSALNFANFDHADNKWIGALPEDHFNESGDNKIIEWFEEIDIKELFPTNKQSVFVAEQASGKSFMRQLSHQEGQTYTENHILNKLKE